jgi:hypothetical protein
MINARKFHVRDNQNHCSSLGGSPRREQDVLPDFGSAGVPQR